MPNSTVYKGNDLRINAMSGKTETLIYNSRPPSSGYNWRSGAMLRSDALVININTSNCANGSV